MTARKFIDVSTKLYANRDVFRDFSRTFNEEMLYGYGALCRTIARRSIRKAPKTEKTRARHVTKARAEGRSNRAPYDRQGSGAGFGGGLKSKQVGIQYAVDRKKKTVYIGPLIWGRVSRPTVPEVLEYGSGKVGKISKRMRVVNYGDGQFYRTMDGSYHNSGNGRRVDEDVVFGYIRRMKRAPKADGPPVRMMRNLYVRAFPYMRPANAETSKPKNINEIVKKASKKSVRTQKRTMTRIRKNANKIWKTIN